MTNDHIITKCIQEGWTDDQNYLIVNGEPRHPKSAAAEENYLSTLGCVESLLSKLETKAIKVVRQIRQDTAENSSIEDREIISRFLFARTCFLSPLLRECLLHSIRESIIDPPIKYHEDYFSERNWIMPYGYFERVVDDNCEKDILVKVLEGVWNSPEFLSLARNYPYWKSIKFENHQLITASVMHAQVPKLKGHPDYTIFFPIASNHLIIMSKKHYQIEPILKYLAGTVNTILCWTSAVNYEEHSYIIHHPRQNPIYHNLNPFDKIF